MVRRYAGGEPTGCVDFSGARLDAGISWLLGKMMVVLRVRYPCYIIISLHETNFMNDVLSRNFLPHTSGLPCQCRVCHRASRENEFSHDRLLSRSLVLVVKRRTVGFSPPIRP